MHVVDVSDGLAAVKRYSLFGKLQGRAGAGIVFNNNSSVNVDIIISAGDIGLFGHDDDPYQEYLPTISRLPLTTRTP